MAGRMEKAGGKGRKRRIYDYMVKKEGKEGEDEKKRNGWGEGG